MKKIYLAGLLAILSHTLSLAQNFTDGLFMNKKQLCGGVMYSHDQWTKYWEGTLKRTNENIGTISTQSTTIMGSYGITDKLNVLMMLPYVWTHSSSGTLRNMSGVQDLTVGLKYNAFRKEMLSGQVRLYAVGAYSLPLTNYTPDFMPLSIGLHSQTLSGRGTAYYRHKSGLYVNLTGSYNRRNNITLDRPSYYVDGQLINSNKVRMPDMIDFMASIGYLKGAMQGDLFFTHQNTLDGSDIRRQEMPFPSYRMNFSKAGALIMYYLPKPAGLAVRASASYTLAGRNVGQSTTLSAGLFYRIQL